ncbi:chromodomain-helicase-DNA-binding protein 6 isoform X1 [Paramormyrops kingsleyae]|uniref:chromodomain-helicase-DNA-binding protein 6 isoform X1 n=2 Tax=Paramormyrops kingsleyae TaxID=1676925 RepID=UPI000CD63AC4|nr:chromodomain-helicase-DNA-binding protein 6-like isoform X1 [Paramormyrops kingsleyae]XP_023651100.1 chromodomain-helicase-DNA-binding protein 6-like isoform X1 [Paramormyrops kingsleyae]XP_023651101.1 chromodomain-helicase-DNA-binding protein 6-like isoform X1 [Paramormyrops kingsleyae]
MKIQKKDKQMSTTQLLKHTSSSVAPTATDQKAQSRFSSSPSGLQEQSRGSSGLTNHCMAHSKQLSFGEVGPAAGRLSPRPQSTPLNGEEDDGGGGARVKKKRKKKDRKEVEPWHKGEKDPKPKKKKEAVEGKELLPRRSKELKKGREPKLAKEPKKAKKSQEARAKSKLKASRDCKSTPSPPKQRGRKAKEQGPVPPEKKKKGKRKSDVLQEAAESDETASLCALATGNEESSDTLDGTKRRSGRQVKRRKYNEDLDFKVVDDDGETIAVLGTGRIQALSSATLAWQAEEPPEDEANIIEKILAVRMVKKEASQGELPQELEEFYVKYRNFSYLHCKWATLEELEKDPRIHQKIKRFRNKQAQMKHIFTEPDEDLFNPDYIEVDRVLEVAHTTDTETGEDVTHYLVKWCSLSYEESTWELQEDVDPGKIQEFEDNKKIPELKHVERPLPDQWKKLEQSRDYRNGNQLRKYQLEGMNWLLFNWYNRKNCILADEMGLGKTIQSITFLYEIFLMGLRGPFLIIAPLSTITNWEREFRTWTEMNAIVFHGSQISRQMILQYEMYHRDEQGNPILGMFKFHGVITTFEMIMADCPELKKIRWRCVVIDEAHRLKNRNCKLLEGLKLMNLEHKVLLTGTPLQNSVEELFSLLNFLEPVQFPSETSFLEEFGDLKTEEQVKKLQAILKPMMLRRLKDDVEKNLAPKEETIIEVELTNIQKKYYRAILEKNFTFLAKGANQHNMPNLINTMMELRKCCNHPYLITGAEEKILESFKKTHSPDAWDFQLQAMIQAAGKLVLIDKLLPKLIAGGHKVLIFSQMVRCLDILEDYLIQRRYTYERIDGRVRGNLRQAAIDRFCKADSDRFVFLLCTRAGGLGINLTAADTCIIFDSDWNPQNDLQAQARCHRIGQSKAVKVYRLITRNSYEREMFDKASLKLGLDKAVLQDINRKGSLNGVQQLSKMEVEDLLRKGAYGALMDEEDEGSKFCEEDIDQILQRRTQTITIQSEGKGSTFAKASFVSSGNRTDISLDDPNFWQKWAKIAELEVDSKAEKESLVIDTPRVRKQTRHYNSFEDDELMEFSELDSDSEERPCRTRRLSDRNRRYLRAECFRVEKNLLIFGWGRWKDILTHGRFKWHLSEHDMELLCRALLVYCVRHYKGDDQIKSFIWDLITPTKDGHDQALVNHSGLSAPVPRGRKGKKLKNQLCQPELKNADWLATCNPEVVLQDESYKKHLKQHCNKVLLRVRMLYYLKVEVLGEAAALAMEGTPARKLDVALPDIDYVEIPAGWWDSEADKSLLIGVHKHGYERYNAMRADLDLCFLERVGMPDVTALSAEQGGGEALADVTDSICKSEEVKDDSEGKPEVSGENEQPEEDAISFNEILEKGESTVPAVTVSESVDQGRALWPASSALTARLRRLITAYQRFTRREPMRHDFLVPEGTGPMAWQFGEEFRRRVTEPDPLFLEWQQRWTRREQADFYRTVSSFGVVYDPEKKAFDWTQFRCFARLERKTDESLERYFCSFVSMCRTACRLPPRKDEGPVDPTLFVEPITEERAARTLYRIELLRKVREQVLRHPLLGPRLQLCQPSLYLPVWWECGKHDGDLLVGVAKHGLSRTDYYILNDPQLSFLEAHRNYVQKESRRYPAAGVHPNPHPQHPHPCCPYEAGLSRCHSPQSAEFHVGPAHHSHAHLHGHGIHHVPEAVGPDSVGPLGVGPAGRESFLDCPPLDESLDLTSLQHDGLASDSLHGKPTKEALNGFPFNSATAGHSMLNPYGGQADTDPIPGKLRSDVLVGAPCPCEETGLIAPSVQLDDLQAPWDSEDHGGTADMFDESDTILGPPSLETEFLDSGQPGESRGDGGLADCLGMPGSDSQGTAVEPLQPSFLLFKDLSDSGPASGSDYVAPPASLSGVSLHPRGPGDEPEEKLSDSDVTRSVPSPGDGVESVTFELDKEELSRDSQSLLGPEPGLEQEKDQDQDENHEEGQGLEQEPEQAQSQDQGQEHSQGASLEPVEGRCDTGDESTLGGHAFPSGESSSPSLSAPSPSLVVPPADAPVVSQFKSEFPLETLEPDSTMPSPRLEQTSMLLVKDDIKEERPKTPALLEESRFAAAPQSVCEMPDSLTEVREPTIAQLLQEKALYSFSDWPKDRVIINRIDSICHAILKGKWPTSGQQYESPSCVPNSVSHRAAYIPARVQPPQNLGYNISAPVSHLPKESLVGVPFLADLKRGRRVFEYEAEVPGKPCPAVEKIPVGMPHRAGALLLNGWQEAAMDLSKAGELGMGGEPAAVGHAGPHKLPPLGPLQSSRGLDMASILQAGLIHPVTGQIVNGNLRRDDAAMRRRRGRRRNVEGPEVDFPKSRELHTPDPQSGPDAISQSTVSSSSSSTPPERPPVAPHPEGLVLDREAANKGLLEWLRQNPNYTMELSPFSPPQNVGILHGFVERPKQRRHRCKDPSKLDASALTGEERVPVVHKGTGRRLGGAMAPAIKELSRWLDANSDYCVAPDWADIVKHSGFLPEGKFTRILTEPVCRDPGPRKRGRRPRGDMSKAGILLSDSHSGMGPLFMNGLIGNMDLMSLQNLRNVPGIPLSGLMGFPPGFTAVPAGEDTKNGLSVLPMMLHGMAAVQPHVFGVGGLMSQSAATGTPAPSAAGTASAAASPASSSDLATPCPTGVETEPPGTQGGPEDGKQEKPPVEGKAGVACGHREPPATPVSGSGSHLTFNPFLIPGMSHGLLYPHMFLPHGGIMALQGVACADGAGSPKRKKKKVREEVAEDPAGKGSPQTDGTALRGPAHSQTEGSSGVIVEPPGEVERREADRGPRTPPGEGVHQGTEETDTVAEDMEKAETRGQGEEPDEEGPGGGGKSPLPSF